MIIKITLQAAVFFIYLMTFLSSDMLHLVTAKQRDRFSERARFKDRKCEITLC